MILEELREAYGASLVDSLQVQVMSALGVGGLFEDGDHLVGLIIVLAKLDLV